METYSATIDRRDDKTSLSFHMGELTLEIILTQDKPNEVKAVFNKLLVELKKGKFQFELSDTSKDLYHEISTEYISQLNRELLGIYQELEDYELIDLDNSESDG